MGLANSLHTTALGSASATLADSCTASNGTMGRSTIGAFVIVTPLQKNTGLPHVDPSDTPLVGIIGTTATRRELVTRHGRQRTGAEGAPWQSPLARDPPPDVSHFLATFMQVRRT